MSKANQLQIDNLVAFYRKWEPRTNFCLRLAYLPMVIILGTAILTLIKIIPMFFALPFITGTMYFTAIPLIIVVIFYYYSIFVFSLAKRKNLLRLIEKKDQNV